MEEREKRDSKLTAIENATKSFQSDYRGQSPTPSAGTEGGGLQSQRLTIGANNTKSFKMFESNVRINTTSTDASSYNILHNETSGSAIKLVDKDQELDRALNSPLPHIVVEEDTYNLTDLLQSEFPMRTTDKAFDLTHEDLIKVASILLYKFNLSAKKNQYQRTELTKLFTERMNRSE